jgi:hypothetical protein
LPWRKHGIYTFWSRSALSFTSSPSTCGINFHPSELPRSETFRPRMDDFVVNFFALAWEFVKQRRKVLTLKYFLNHPGGLELVGGEHYNSTFRSSRVLFFLFSDLKLLLARREVFFSLSGRSLRLSCRVCAFSTSF